MSRSNSWRLSRNDSIRTARPGALCSQLPDNRIALSEGRSNPLRREISDARVSFGFPDCEEFNAIIGVRVLRRGPCRQHGEGAGDLMLLQPSLRIIAPVIRFVDQLDRLHAVG